MWMCKDGMFFGKEFGNLGLFFFLSFFYTSDIAQFGVWWLLVTLNEKSVVE